METTSDTGRTTSPPQLRGVLLCAALAILCLFFQNAWLEDSVLAAHLARGAVLFREGSLTFAERLLWPLASRPADVETWLLDGSIFAFFSTGERWLGQGDTSVAAFLSLLAFVGFWGVRRLALCAQREGIGAEVAVAFAFFLFCAAQRTATDYWLFAITPHLLSEMWEGRRRSWGVVFLLSFVGSCGGALWLGALVVPMVFALGCVLDRRREEAVHAGIAVLISLAALLVTPASESFFQAARALLTFHENAGVEQLRTPDFHVAKFLNLAIVVLVASEAFRKERAAPSVLLLLFVGLVPLLWAEELVALTPAAVTPAVATLCATTFFIRRGSSRSAPHALSYVLGGIIVSVAPFLFSSPERDQRLKELQPHLVQLQVADARPVTLPRHGTLLQERGVPVFSDFRPGPNRFSIGASVKGSLEADAIALFRFTDDLPKVLAFWRFTHAVLPDTNPLVAILRAHGWSDVATSAPRAELAHGHVIFPRLVILSERPGNRIFVPTEGDRGRSPNS